MGGILSVVGPRILIPTFFIGQKVSTLDDPVQIAQTIAFSFLFVSFAFLIFSKEPWIALIPGVASLAYYMMIRDKSHIEQYRYADWMLTTPLMLLAILVTNNASLLTITGTLGADIVMILSGFFGAQASSDTLKMGLFSVGCIAFIPILYILSTMKKARYAVLLTLIMWILYPILWIVDEKALITKDNANITYSVMDVVAKVGLVNLLHV
jgi:bacteriorhodopsin